MKFVLPLRLFTESMVGVAYFIWVFSIANLKLKDNPKLCRVDING